MQKVRDYKLTAELLDSYQHAALDNARELLDEARVLLSNDYFARAYFLSLASIEEAGKAYIAFDAKGRNLKDEGLCTKIKERLEDHSGKITSAFVGWISFSDSPREAVKTSVDLMIHLKRGREKSMYIDLKSDGITLSIPREVVRPVAARDCTRLAENCLHHTERYIQDNKPSKRTTYQDKLLCIKQKTLTEMLNTEDFWEYYIDQLEHGNNSYDQAVVTYHDGFYKKKKVFKQATS
ncbi:MAG TPA: AbiV family abortive infection protein [Gammaproteobacteria bacterium]|nr:AbiV family abortive infection protein [Gammaproteobacteria bacterium]